MWQNTNTKNYLRKYAKHKRHQGENKTHIENINKGSNDEWNEEKIKC